MTTEINERVEQVAIQIWLNDSASLTGYANRWSELKPRHAEHYLSIARAALAALNILALEQAAYERGYSDHRNTVIDAMCADDATESIADFLQTRMESATGTRIANDEAMDMAGDLLFALVTAIRLEDKTDEQ